MTTSAEEAVKYIKSKDNVYIHSAAAVPSHLVKAMTDRAEELRDVSIYQIHTESDAPYAASKLNDSFIIKAMFVGSNTRDNIQNGRGSYIPIFLSEAASLFGDKIVPLDVALISVSPPDKHGYCSLGTSVDISLAAMRAAKLVIAQVNEYMPRTFGDGVIHVSDLNFLVHHNEPLPEVHTVENSKEISIIGKHIASLIEDGSTLQMGIGAIPNAVLNELGNHNNLGIHTEMFSDGLISLVEKGVVNGKYKKKFPGKIVASFVVGSKKLYDFLDDNPIVHMLDSSYVNNTDIIRKHQKMVAINSAIEIDLTGQVCADSIGCKIFSGVGGQMDFIRGASLSEGGKPIIAMTSTTKRGESKIVPFLKKGAGVVTTRAHVHYIVTEYGVVNLFGKTIEERIKLLIDIAHPAHRESLTESAKMLLA